MPDLTNLQREIAALNRSQARALTSGVPSPAPGAVNLGLALRLETRVLDLVTGEEGVIIDGTAEHIITGTAGQ